MISSTDIKRSYVKLYRQMRDYLWDYQTVCALARVESEALVRFPNVRKLRNALYELGSFLYRCRQYDEDLDVAYRNMQRLLESDGYLYAYLPVNVANNA